MNLQGSSFGKIRDGHKDVEARLRDEKRRAMRVGDQVRFVNRDDGSSVIADVVELVEAPTFVGLFEAVGATAIGDESVDDHAKLYDHYAREDEQRFGVIGIRIANVRKE